MTGERAVYAYAWDVLEAGADAVAAELAAHGLNTLSLASSYHAGKFIRPRGQAGKVVFPDDGTVYFHHRAERYGAVRPQRSRVVADTDPFAMFGARSDLKVNAWTVLLHNTRLGTLHPELVVRNAFGDPYVYSLCPSQPAVREYAVTLCADLADQYPVTGLSLETPGWLPYAHGYHHEFAQVESNPWLMVHLGLCFCDACMAAGHRAGIPMEELKRETAARVAGYLASPVVAPADMAREWLIADFVGNAELAAFQRWRGDVVTSLVEEIRAAVREDARVTIIPSVQRPTASSWSEGTDLAALARAADAIDLCLYEPSPARALADLWDARRRVGPDATLRAILRPGPPDMESGAQAAATVAALRAAGIEDLAFYNYGMLRAHNLGWVRDALATIDKTALS